MTRVLVIDDEPVIGDLMTEILAEGGYPVETARSAGEALAKLEDDSIALVVSDIVMPGLTGLELLEEVRIRRPSLPVVLVTGAGTHANLSEAVARGADGFVMKPFAHDDLLKAVGAAIGRAARSERDLRDRLLAPTLAAALANAIEAREASLHGHCERLSAFAVRLAAELGVPREVIETVRLGAILHDVGKIGIPDRILLKPGPLDAAEFALMKTHTLIDDRLLEPLDLLQNVRPIVRHHHERWDGHGYPDRLGRDAIPITARIVAVADAVEAMSAHRPYRDPLAVDEIEHELAAGRGSQWDPAAVDAALQLMDNATVRFGARGVRVVSGSQPADRDVPNVSVLLVGDDRPAAALAKEAIEQAVAGAAVAVAADLESARELVEAYTFTLVVVDNFLPDGEGIELLEAVRKRAPHVPVVMLTGEGSERLAVEAFRRGATDYVVKRNGFVDELTSRVQSLLEAA